MVSEATVSDPERIREISLRALERRRHSRRELELKLRRKGVSADAAAPVLDRLTEVGLLDDAAFARAFVASRQERRPRGPHALRRELAARGVSRDIIDEVLEEQAETEDPVDSATRALRPRLRGLSSLPPERARAKAAQFLAGRGFSYDVIERVLSGLDPR